MNKVILMGRLTRDPEVRYTQGDNQMAIARYTLAVDRRFNRSGDENTADFIPCVAFGKSGEVASHPGNWEGRAHQSSRRVFGSLSTVRRKGGGNFIH